MREWDVFVKAARARVKGPVDEFRSDVGGKWVAFSGAGIHPAGIREALALKFGFVYGTSVRDDTDLLVVGTERTATTQVEMAQAAGVPVMVESTFWRRLGEL